MPKTKKVAKPVVRRKFLVGLAVALAIVLAATVVAVYLRDGDSSKQLSASTVMNVNKVNEAVDGEVPEDVEAAITEAVGAEAVDGEVPEDVEAAITEAVEEAAAIESKIRGRMGRGEEMAQSKVAKGVLKNLGKFDDLSEKRQEKLAEALDNVVIGFSGEKLEEVLASKTKTTGAASALQKVLEKNRGKLPEVAIENMERVIEFSGVRNFTADGAKTATEALESYKEAIEEMLEEEEGFEGVNEKLEKLMERLDDVYRTDKVAQRVRGLLPFDDLQYGEDAWYFGYALAAREQGLLTGEMVDGVAVMSPERYTNNAEAIAMVARAAAGGKENIPEEVDMEDPVVARQPDWARTSATFLKRKGVNLAEVFGEAEARTATTRGQMMELVAQALDLGSDDLSVLDGFPDVGELTANRGRAAAGLVVAGIVQGDTLADGSKRLNLENPLNRAAFVKIIVEALQSAEEKEEKADKEDKKPVFDHNVPSI